MRRVAAVLGTAAMVVMTTAVFAQKPNFAGKWTVDAEKTAAANPAPAGGAAGGGGGRAGGGAGGGGGMRGGGGGTFELKMDGNNLIRVQNGQDGTPVETKYVTDGAKHDGTQQGTSYVAKWEGNTIVIETTRVGQDGTPMAPSKLVYSMEGEWLVGAQTTTPRGGGEATTRKTYYKKA